MPDHDVLDPGALAVLDAMTDGDAAFLAELIDTWVEDSAAQLAAMEQARTAGDAEALRRAAHSLKSTSQSLGAGLLANTCAEIEAHAKDGVVGPAADLLPVAQRQYEQARAALLALRPRD